MKDVKVYFGDMSQVNPIDNKNYEEYLQYTEKKQELPGFDEEYNDIIDYILKITHRIWEEKGVGLIYDTYAVNCKVHTGDATAVGVAGVVSNTIQTLHSYPDRRCMAEDVIWTEDAPGDYYSSHRVLSTGTNLGDGSWGPATGKFINFRTIADCACKNNLIYEEWLVRDNLWMVKQLGIDPHELAKKLAGSAPAKRVIGRNECMDGQIKPCAYVAKDESVGEKLKELYNDVYNRKMINRICDYYAENAVVHTICNRELIGFSEIQGSVISLLASFPNSILTIDRIGVNDYGEDKVHASLRWRLRGIHEGIGEYGDPSGNFVEILGISHFNFEKGKIVEAWEIYDGLDVLRQIYLGKNEPAGEACPCECEKENIEDEEA